MFSSLTQPPKAIKSFTISLGDQGPLVTVTRKRIRRITLRVKSPADIRCSAPVFMSQKDITSFILSKKDWIIKASQKVKKQEERSGEIFPDSVAAALGFSREDFTPVYSERWKKAAMENFQQAVERYRIFFEKGALPDFSVKGRSMKSLWGSCNRRSRVVTLNWALLRFSQDCIDYVVFHELTHFLYIHHDRNFYGYISRFMPDYRERIKKLNQSRPR